MGEHLGLLCHGAAFACDGEAGLRKALALGRLLLLVDHAGAAHSVVTGRRMANDSIKSGTFFLLEWKEEKHRVPKLDTGVLPSTSEVWSGHYSTSCS